jgi:hypothetical protein
MSERIEHRPPKWIWGVALAAFALFALLAAVSVLASNSRWVTALLLALSLFAGFGILEVAMRRVILTPSGMELVANLRRQFVPRSEIASVTWAKGSGVSLKLVAGTWLRLPEVGPGSQGLANSVRAWLNRTTASPS